MSFSSKLVSGQKYVHRQQSSSILIQFSIVTKPIPKLTSGSHTTGRIPLFNAITTNDMYYLLIKLFGCSCRWSPAVIADLSISTPSSSSSSFVWRRFRSNRLTRSTWTAASIHSKAKSLSKFTILRIKHKTEP